MASISKNIKRLRTAQKLTQEQLAVQLNVTRQTISSWENDRTQPDINMLAALSTALNTDIEDLIYGSFSYNLTEKDSVEIMLKIASKTEIESFKSIEISDDHHRAKVRFRIRYIDLLDLQQYFDYRYMTKEEWLEAIDSYDELKSSNMTFSLINR